MSNKSKEQQNGQRGEQRGRSIKGGKPTPAAGWRFMEVQLSKEQREQFKAWKTDLYELFSLVTSYNLHGIKFALSFNSRTQSHICSVTDAAEDSVNYGITFTSHGNTPDLALALCLFKLEFILAKMDAWEAPVNRDELWG